MATLHSLNTPAQHPTITLVDGSGNIFYPASSPTPGTTATAEPLDADQLTSGEATMHRRYITSNNVATLNASLRLTYFTARKSETITSLRLISGSTAASTSPTLVRAGVYSVADNGDLTLVAAIANDITLFASALTAYTRALTASFSKVVGQRYAVGILVVTAVTAPMVLGNANGVASEMGQAPKLAAVFNGQTDLPASITNAQAVDTGTLQYSVLVP